MTREKVIELLMIIDATYPNFNPGNLKDTADAWEFVLADYDYSQISVALKNFMISDTKGFAPTPGQLIGQIHELEDLGDLSEIEATTLIMKAVRNSAYNSDKEFAKLPPMVQKAVGSASQLRMWAVDDHFNQSVVESNVQRVYRSVAKQGQNYRRMSPEFKAIADKVFESRPQIESKVESKTLLIESDNNIDAENDKELGYYAQMLEEKFK